jgi:hypothetical protein
MQAAAFRVRIRYDPDAPPPEPGRRRGPGPDDAGRWRDDSGLLRQLLRRLLWHGGRGVLGERHDAGTAVKEGSGPE